MGAWEGRLFARNFLTVCTGGSGPPPAPSWRRGFRGARYSMWIVLVRVARFFRGEPIVRDRTIRGKVVVVQKVRFSKPAPDRAHAHSFPHALPPSPRKLPATAQFPSFRRGARRAGWSARSRLRREPLPAYISSLIARTSPSVSSAIFATVAGSRPSASMLRTSRRVFSSRPCSRPTSRSHIIDSRTSS